MNKTSSVLMNQGNVIGADSPTNGIVMGNRIPRDYFITQGVGESDITVHAGSYHLALKDAGIERANIMTYSSILPGIAQEIEQPKTYAHGEVMESIMAVATGTTGEQLAAGIIFGWLHHRDTGKKYGGLVCEHNGNYSEAELVENLQASLNELYFNGFEEDFYIGEKRLLKQMFVPKKKYGTALVSLCFTNYVLPIIS